MPIEQFPSAEPQLPGASEPSNEALQKAVKAIEQRLEKLVGAGAQSTDLLQSADALRGATSKQVEQLKRTLAAALDLPRSQEVALVVVRGRPRPDVPLTTTTRVTVYVRQVGERNAELYAGFTITTSRGTHVSQLRLYNRP